MYTTPIGRSEDPTSAFDSTESPPDLSDSAYTLYRAAAITSTTGVLFEPFLRAPLLVPFRGWTSDQVQAALREEKRSACAGVRDWTLFPEIQHCLYLGLPEANEFRQRSGRGHKVEWSRRFELHGALGSDMDWISHIKSRQLRPVVLLDVEQ
jgi:hypothetical protein